MFRGHYDNWINSRMNGIKKYIQKDYFKSKTLLELGCGHGHIGNEFYKLGSIVSSSDARKEHINVVSNIYPHIETLLIDCDNDDILKKYDIILHWGLLYHLNEIEIHLKKVSKRCDLLLLESEVCDSDDDTFYIKGNEYNNYDQAFNSIGIRPSQTYVEKILKNNGFQYSLIKDPILNSNFHIYNWDIQNTNTYQNGLRRFWICWKNIESPLIDNLIITNNNYSFPTKIISLGGVGGCCSGRSLRSLNQLTYPYDWLITIQSFVLNSFNNFENFFTFDEKYLYDNTNLVDKNNKAVMIHDLKRQNFMLEKDKVIEKYKRRFNRLYDDLNRNNNILFVRVCDNLNERLLPLNTYETFLVREEEDIEKWEKFIFDINIKYNNDNKKKIKLLVITNIEDICKKTYNNIIMYFNKEYQNSDIISDIIKKTLDSEFKINL